MNPIIIAIVLALIGVGLVAWAVLNPEWQRAEAYDAILPFFGGVFLVVIAIVVWICTWVFAGRAG